MSVNSTSPATLFGGTWEQIEDTFLLCAGNTYTAGNTGGVASVAYTPAGTVGNHTLTVAEMPSHAHGLNNHVHSVGGHTHGLNSHVHGLNNHVHSVGAHSHGLNSHTHGLNSHTHGLNSHVHSLNSHTHGIGSYTAADNGAHSHKFRSYYGFDSNIIYGVKAMADETDWCRAALSAYNGYTGAAFKVTMLDCANHTHTLSGTSGASSGNTGAASGSTAAASGNTAAASGSTANNTAFDSGKASGNTAAASGSTASNTAFDSGKASGNTAANGSDGAHNHGFTGTAVTFDNMPPYLVVYMWKRTA